MTAFILNALDDNISAGDIDEDDFANLRNERGAIYGVSAKRINSSDRSANTMLREIFHIL